MKSNSNCVLAVSLVGVGGTLVLNSNYVLEGSALNHSARASFGCSLLVAFFSFGCSNSSQRVDGGNFLPARVNSWCVTFANVF